jgi:hypothetical protein
MHGGDKQCIPDFSWKSEGNKHLEHTDVGRRIILKWILKK